MSYRAGKSVFGVAPAISAVIVALAIGGCARPRGVLFEPPVSPRVWPAPPEQARIRYVGAISGSDDLKASRSGAEVLQAALRGPRQPIRFVSPHGVARGPNGLLAVTDGGIPGIHLINLDERTHTLVTGWADQHFQVPVGVTFAGDRVLVADAARGEVVEVTADGSFVRAIGSIELSRPVGVTWMPSRGELFVVDGGADAILVFDEAGRYLRTVGGPGVEPGKFNRPTHVAAQGEVLLVADAAGFRVQLLDPMGNALSVFGQKGDGAGDFSLPKGVAFDRGGHVYVVDAQFENVQIFDRRGRLLLAFGQEGSGMGEFSLPAGIAIDNADRIWIADAGNRRIQVFDFVGAAS
ncbi:MAG: 6-bladed beta-propeller [Phycisphaerae bacterium]|nr:6-bladed beta-propeller [Phycisphaerae bacterium]